MKYHVLTSHQLEAIQTCPRFAYFDLIMELTPIGSKAKLERGTLVHKLLEYHYLEKLQNVYDHKASVDRVITQGEVYSLSELHLESDTVQECIDRYRAYAEEYQYEDWKIKSVEERFSKLIYVVEDAGCIQHLDGIVENCPNCHEGFSLLYEGRKDLVITTRKLEALGMIVVDHKTGEKNDEINKRSNQFMGYCWAEGGTTLVVNRILFVKDPTNWFHRPFVSFNNESLEEWRHSVGYYFSEYLRWKESGVFSPNNSSCARYGRCVFQDICDTTQDNRAWKIESAYRKKEQIDYFGRK